MRLGTCYYCWKNTAHYCEPRSQFLISCHHDEYMDFGLKFWQRQQPCLYPVTQYFDSHDDDHQHPQENNSQKGS